MPVPAFLTHPLAIVGLVVVVGGTAIYEVVKKGKKHDDKTPDKPPADPSDAAAAAAGAAANANVPPAPAPTDSSTAIATTPVAVPPPAMTPPAPPVVGPPVVGPMGFRRHLHRPRPPALRAPAPGMAPVVVAPAIVGGQPVPTGDITADVVHRLAFHGYREVDMPLYKRAQRLYGLNPDGFPGPAFMRALTAAARVKGLPMPHLPIYEFKNLGARGWDGHHNAPLLKDWKAR